jgi:LacI family transcriptional regulator
MVTIQDIAEKLQVSKTTVSLVLNNRGKELRIGENTRNLVEKVSSEMGYARNEIARSMVTGRNDVIAFVSCDTGAYEYIGKIMSGILEEASRQNFAVKVSHLAHSTPDKIIRQLVEQRIAGVIFHSDKSADFDFIRNETGRKHIPYATVNLSSEAAGIGVTTDDAQGTSDAVKYLAGLGHRRISYISNKSRLEFIVNRENGYIAGMKEHVPGSGNLKISYGISTDYNENQAPIRSILSGSRTKRPSAIICYSDSIACNVLQVAYQMGIKVPDELSIIGFADLDIAKFATVPLTTVAQPFEEMGRETANMLIDAIKNKRSDILEKPENRKLEVKLVVRKSTAAPRQIRVNRRIGESAKRR